MKEFGMTPRPIQRKPAERKAAEQPGARLTMEVHFDKPPEMDYLQEIVDKAREYGHVKKATLNITAPKTIELV